MDLVCGAAPTRLLMQAAAEGMAARVKQLPDLSPLAGRLTALSLADNNFERVRASGQLGAEGWPSNTGTGCVRAAAAAA